MPDTSVVTSDPMTTAAIATIKELAIGNDVTDAEVVVTEAVRVDHAMSVMMHIGIKPAQSTERTYGTTHPQNSRHVSNNGAASKWVGDSCAALASSPATLDELAKEVGTTPRQSFERLKGGDQIGKRSFRAHHHETCGGCSGNGDMACTNWSNAGYVDGMRCTVSCTHCRGVGRTACTSGCSNGTQYLPGGGSQRCTSCGGSGLSYSSCPVCSGAKVVAHGPCRGLGRVRCGACSGHGAFTCSTTGWLKAEPLSFCSFPEGFDETVKGNLKQVFGVQDLLQQSDASEGRAYVYDGKAYIMIPVKLAHVHLKMAFGHIHTGDFDFFGRDQRIRFVRPFVSNLLSDRFTKIGRKGDKVDPLVAIKTAQGSRVTREILQAASGKAVDAKTIAKRWKGSVEDWHVEEALASLRASYDKLGVVAGRRFWVFAAPPLVAWAAAVPALSLAMPIVTLGDRTQYWTDPVPNLWVDAVVGLTPLAMAWVVSGLVAKHQVRKLTGEQGRMRAPARGRVAAIAVILACLVLPVLSVKGTIDRATILAAQTAAARPPRATSAPLAATSPPVANNRPRRVDLNVPAQPRRTGPASGE